MITRRNLWPSLMLVALLSACTVEDTAVVTDEISDDAAQVLDAEAAAAVLDGMEQAYIDAYGAEDAAGIAALFTADGMQAQPLLPRLDVAGVQEAYATQFASGGDFSLEVEREGMVVSAGMIASWGGFAATVAMEGEEPVPVAGRYGVIQRLEADGTWKIYRHMFNYEVPPPDFGQ